MQAFKIYFSTNYNHTLTGSKNALHMLAKKNYEKYKMQCYFADIYIQLNKIFRDEETINNCFLKI